jgi:hypothetical protein
MIVAPRVSDRGEADLDVDRCIVLPEQPASELATVVGDDAVRHTKTAHQPTYELDGCRWISCLKNTGYHVTDPKIRTQGAKRGRSWIATKQGDGSLESSNAQCTAERDTELYPGSGPSW